MLLTNYSDLAAVRSGLSRAGRRPLQYMEHRSGDSSEAEVAGWMEGGAGRQDLVAGYRTCRGWEERVVVVVDIGGGDTKANLVLRTVARLVLVEQ